MIGLEAKLSHLEAGTAAPGFELKTYEGQRIKLSELLQRGPVVVTFFKISCPVCQFTFPFLQRLHKRIGVNHASLIAISQDDARDTRDFCQEFGADFPVLLDDSAYSVSNSYGITNVPTVFLIAPDGAIKVECMGFDKAGLEKIATQVTATAHLSAAPLFRPDEIVPAYKPG